MTLDEKFNAYFKAFPDLFFATDPDGVITDYRAGNRGDLYVSDDDFLGKKMAEVLPPDVGGLFVDAFNKVSEFGDMKILNYELKVPSGLKHFEARILAGPDAIFLIFVRDITALADSRRKIEESSKASSEFSIASETAIELLMIERDRNRTLQSQIDALESQVKKSQC